MANTDKPSKINIPESVENYKVTLFWGLTIKQVVLLFIATLLVGFGIYSLAGRRPVAATLMFLLCGLTLLAMIEIRGRNFYRHIVFIFSYYKSKPQVLIYHHQSDSGLGRLQAKQLVYGKQDNSRFFIIIIASVIFGLALLTLTGIYLYHVIHQ